MFLRFSLLIAIVAFAAYWFHVRMRPEDTVGYDQLVQARTQSRNQKVFSDKPLHQLREGVQKDLWSENETRHFQIRSDFSELGVAQRAKLEAVEELQGITAICDDFSLSADEGIYTFPSHQFIAKDNCKIVQHENEIQGQKVHFDVGSETVVCESPKGHLGEEVNFTAKHLLWNRKEGKLYLNGSVHLISSRIQDKESFAIADQLIYNLTDKTILLSAKKRVLFWQDGLSLSASQVLVKSGEVGQSIEGKGDVHFAFDLDEQNSIEDFLKHYL